MGTPFAASFELDAPELAGQPNCPVSLNFGASYDVYANYQLALSSGPGTKTLDFGTFGPNGAKMLVVYVRPTSDPLFQPVLLTFNGATVPTAGQIELSAGGWLVLASPQPTGAGVLSMTIHYPGNAGMNIWAYG